MKGITYHQTWDEIGEQIEKCIRDGRKVFHLTLDGVDIRCEIRSEYAAREERIKERLEGFADKYGDGDIRGFLAS